MPGLSPSPFQPKIYDRSTETTYNIEIIGNGLEVNFIAEPVIPSSSISLTEPTLYKISIWVLHGDLGIEPTISWDFEATCLPQEIQPLADFLKDHSELFARSNIAIFRGSFEELRSLLNQKEKSFVLDQLTAKRKENSQQEPLERTLNVQVHQIYRETPQWPLADYVTALTENPSQIPLQIELRISIEEMQETLSFDELQWFIIGKDAQWTGSLPLSSFEKSVLLEEPSLQEPLRGFFRLPAIAALRESLPQEYDAELKSIYAGRWATHFAFRFHIVPKPINE